MILRGKKAGGRGHGNGSESARCVNANVNATLEHRASGRDGFQHVNANGLHDDHGQEPGTLAVTAREHGHDYGHANESARPEGDRFSVVAMNEGRVSYMMMSAHSKHPEEVHTQPQ